MNGLRALRRQAERKTESPKVWRQKTRSFGPGLRPWRRRKGKEPKEGKDFHTGRESGLEGEWGTDMDLEDQVESRKKLDEQKRKLQKELRDIDKFSCVPKEIEETLKSYLQQLQEVELMPEHQKVPRRLSKIESIEDKRRNLQKENVAAEEEMRKLRDDVKQKEECILFSVGQSREEQDG